MQKRVIKTELEGREDAFRVLAVAEAIGKPCLLIGVPGTAKTKTLLDYAKAFYNDDQMSTIEKTFILETDEGTKSAEVKGRINVGELVKNNQYVVNSPIVNAEFVLINEIDKASAGLRNSLLGVMNEKYLFNGDEKLPCNWKLFCATANEIPDDEKNSPFWDRFVFKSEVNRINKTQIINYYNKQSGAKKTKDININIPDENEINIIVSNIDVDKLQKFIDVCYSKLSDRTLSYLPKLIAAVSVVYDKGLVQAMIKTCELLCGFETAKLLAKQLEPVEVSALRSKIEMLATYREQDQISKEGKAIKTELERIRQIPGLMTKSDVEDIVNEIKFTISQNPIVKKAQEQMLQGQKSTSDVGTDAVPSF